MDMSHLPISHDRREYHVLDETRGNFQKYLVLNVNGKVCITALNSTDSPALTTFRCDGTASRYAPNAVIASKVKQTGNLHAVEKAAISDI